MELRVSLVCDFCGSFDTGEADGGGFDVSASKREGVIAEWTCGQCGYRTKLHILFAFVAHLSDEQRARFNRGMKMVNEEE